MGIGDKLRLMKQAQAKENLEAGYAFLADNKNKDGVTVYTTDILVDTFTFVGNILSSFLYSNLSVPLLIEKYFNVNNFQSELLLLRSFKTLVEFRNYKYNNIPVGIYSISSLSTHTIESEVNIDDKKIRKQLISLIIKSLHHVNAAREILEKFNYLLSHCLS